MLVYGDQTADEHSVVVGGVFQQWLKVMWKTRHVQDSHEMKNISINSSVQIGGL